MKIISRAPMDNHEINVRALFVKTQSILLGLEIAFVNGDGRAIVERLRARDFYCGAEGVAQLMAYHLCRVINPDSLAELFRTARPSEIRIATAWWAWDPEIDPHACKLMSDAWRKDKLGPFAPGFKLDFETRPYHVRRRLLPIVPVDI